MSVARDIEEVNVAPASLVADALVVTCDGRGKRVGAKSKGQKLNQMGPANAGRPGKCPQRAVSSCVASEETEEESVRGEQEAAEGNLSVFAQMLVTTHICTYSKQFTAMLIFSSELLPRAPMCSSDLGVRKV